MDQPGHMVRPAGIYHMLGSRDIGLAFADKVFGKEANEMEAHLIFPTGVRDADGGGLPPFSILPEMFG